MLQRDDPVLLEPVFIAPEPEASLLIGLSVGEPGMPVLGPPEAPFEPALVGFVEPPASLLVPWSGERPGALGLVLLSVAKAAPVSAIALAIARMVHLMAWVPFRDG
jgi:hypothetical protein